MENQVAESSAIAPEVPTPIPTIPEIAPTIPSVSIAQMSTKQIHSLVIDANAIIKNNPTVSTLLAQAEEFYTIPAVVSEIRDEATRSRFQMTLSPFIKLRIPRPESMNFVTAFARRTGDLQVLSKPDLQLLALTYELEVERNGGDWRLRKEPNQKGLNGKPPGKEEEQATKAPEGAEPPMREQEKQATGAASETTDDTQTSVVAEQLQELNVNGNAAEDTTVADGEQAADGEQVASGDDEDGWITPTNIKKYQAKENSDTTQPGQRFLQAALITADMAMRNVALRINLNLLDSGLSRITFLKTWVLRCHGCWKVSKDTTKQFCPSCGQATLTRVSCSTDTAGNFKLHLKKNFQYNNRGNVYSIPKPTHGSSNGKNVPGGGKNGWGRELILAEDQKEYTKKVEEDRRQKYRDLMDEDYLPGILTGTRTSGNGRIKVGAGRNVNAKKKR